MNGDGHPDVVAFSADFGDISVLLNDGTGRFPTRIDVFPPGLFQPRWLGLGQFAGSAHQDLVLVNDSGEIRIFTGDGAGQFQDSGLVATVPKEAGLFAAAAIADLDGDGRDDLVVGYATNVLTNNTVFRLLGAAGGGFGAPLLVDAVGPGDGAITNVALADLTGDGRPDLIVHVSKDLFGCIFDPPIAFFGTARALGNTGAGAFVFMQSVATGAGANPAIAAADMDGDGRPDLVVTSIETCGSNGRVNVLRSAITGGGAWNGFLPSEVVASTFDRHPRAVEVGDVDGDGRRDLVEIVTPQGAATAHWLLRVHARTADAFASSFAAPLDLAVGVQLENRPRDVGLADLNGDGKPDALVPVAKGSGEPANFPHSVVVFFNTADLPPAGGNAWLSVVTGGAGSGVVTSAPAGITCGGGATACALVLPAGPPAPGVVLTATPAAGSTFTGWSGGGCAGTGTCTVTLDASTTVVAYFALTSELGSPGSTLLGFPFGIGVSFINVGTPGVTFLLLANGNEYTETSVVRVNGLNQATTPLFSGSGAALEALVAYAALPSVAGAPQTTGVSVLNGLPSGPFSLTTPFPLHVLRPCREVPDPCATAVTAVPTPVDANALAVTLHVSASHSGALQSTRINGQDRATTILDGCSTLSCAGTIPVLFGDIVAAGTLAISNNNATNPSLGTLTIRPPVQIVVSSFLPGGTVNGAYGQTLTATGGSNAKAWAVTSGALPPGLTLAAGTGLLSGTPTEAGAFKFVVTVTDTDFPAAKAVQGFSLNIATALVITTTSPLAASTQGVAYAQVTLEATGGTGTRTWTVSAGALPGGMTLSAGGVVSGTPTQAGTFQFTARVTDAAGAFVTKAFAVTINAPLSITTSSLPGGTKGAVYPTQTLAATGGTGGRTWTISAGALPGGLTLSAGGSISGTPTGVGTFNFTVRVTDSVGATATKGLSITVAADTAPPVVTIQSPGPPKGSATSTPLLVSGTAGDNVGVTQVSWANDRGGSGGATGTTAWVASGIPLQPGKNVITITGRDAANNAGTASIAIYFFQDTLSAGSMAIKAVHVLQLATAIENLRTRLGFPGPAGFEWTGTPPAVGGPVRASQLNDLRAALGTLYDHAGMAVGTTFTRTPIAAGTRIDAAHLEQLRAAVRTLP